VQPCDCGINPPAQMLSGNSNLKLRGQRRRDKIAFAFELTQSGSTLFASCQMQSSVLQANLLKFAVKVLL
jgi:hypothetical protein